jgi:hypothetical protein
MKLMLTLGKGERCMRLWNLVTGRKAGVLNFTREVLMGVNESRFSSGEGRRIAWDSPGEEFAVAFEWGAVVFGIVSFLLSILSNQLLTISHRTQLPSAGLSLDLGANFIR